MKHFKKLKPEIRKYNPQLDFEKLMQVIESEGEEWMHYSSELAQNKYKDSLAKSITYVAYASNVLCGYSRSIDDFGFDIYVCDLLVQKSYRGNAIGKQLIDCLMFDFPNQNVYIMSDVDDYYEKLGYKLEGSIYQVVANE